MKSTLLLTTEIGFVIVTVIFLGLLLSIFFKAIRESSWTDEKKIKVRRWIVISMAAWFTFLSFWSLSGIMADFERFPFNFIPIIIIPLVATITITFTGNMRELLLLIPQEKLLALQSFRIFVEILLWMLFVDQVLPVQMTFEGRNFDILAGITGPIVALLYGAGRISPRFLLVWNLA
ncbi:MAG TPA: hypothetical protein VD927_12245, partial [Chryseosolibacter sp.]|nr:hypothetical protein [Chryseosolibacter sp.]